MFPCYIRNILETLDAENIPFDPILERHNYLKEYARLPDGLNAMQAYLKVVTDILRMTPVPGLGFKSGVRFNLSDHGLLGYTVDSSKNLNVALEVFCLFGRISGGYKTRLSPLSEQNLAQFEFSDLLGLPEEVLRFQLEETFTVWHCISRKWAEPCEWLSEVHFTFGPPEYSDLYREYFRCPVRFNQSGNRMLFPVEYLSEPFVDYNEQLFNLAYSQCHELLASVSKSISLIDQIRAILTKCKPGKFLNFEEISRIFNVSPATMRRRLAKEGTNYQQLQREFKMQLACRYLTETDLSVNEITYLTGYSDPANFNRAFRNTQRQSPHMYRLSH